MPESYKITVHDRNYSSWTFFYSDTNAEITVTDPIYETLSKTNPIEHKLMSRDHFVIKDPDAENPEIEVVNSYVKTCKSLPGVLLLENNKTYGRTENKKRLLYKCVPDDKYLPSFLVPYDIKTTGFSKVLMNRYVLFRFDHWKNKHPQGLLVETIGEVDHLPAFYEYQLYCKSLHISIQELTTKTKERMQKQDAKHLVKQIFENPDFQMENRFGERVFTIDPQNSTDLDDGYSIRPLDGGGFKISVYIANVYVWIETLGLWNSLSKRVATIYLPDYRRPMLPTILSEALCSLQEGQDRFAFVMDVCVNSENEIRDVSFKNAMIRVAKNYSYEDPVLLYKDKSYADLFRITSILDPSVKNSHDLVAHWMVFMNEQAADRMYRRGVGIFRSVNYIQPPGNNDDSHSHLDENTRRIIQTWNNTIGQYVCFSDDISVNHEVMDKQSYIHITSPIRRLVDLLNQMLFMKSFGQVARITEEASVFIENWIKQLDYLNISMRSIRKVQTDCGVLEKCFHMPELLHREFHGIIFDKLVRANGILNYMVYIPEMNMLSRVSNTYVDMVNYGSYRFRMYLFEDEDRAKRKIRLCPVFSE
jgi:exoribonuclease R